VWEDENGDRYYAPPRDSRPALVSPAAINPPCPGSGSAVGFYRRHSEPGYNAFQSEVYMPGAPDVQAGSGGEPYLYSGGWGNRGGAVEAGVQYSPRYNWWTLVLFYEVARGRPRALVDRNFHFAARTWLNTLVFSATTDNFVQVSAAGIPAPGYEGRPNVRVLSAEMDPYFDWNGNGDGTILKMTTTLPASSGKILGARWRNPLLFVYGRSTVFFPYHECRQGNAEVVGGVLEYTVNTGR